MATELILQGRVQGVFCRAYCSEYGRRLRVRGSASNLRDGSVRVLLDTDDELLVQQYVSCLRNNPQGVHFYGAIDHVKSRSYTGPIRGDYTF